MVGTLYYLLTDHLGSTTVTTNKNGVFDSELKYDPWGKVTSGSSRSDYTYTGQYSNVDDFGLIYYNARWYDPALGRFAQADTVVPDGPQGWDRYAYVGNNPVNNVDPSGHIPCTGSHWDDGPQCKDKKEFVDKAEDEYRQVLKARFGWKIHGDWSVAQLRTVFSAGVAISGTVGGDDDLRRLLGSVDFDLKAMGYGGLGGAHHVWLNSGGFDTWTVAHELGHSLDADYKWQLSEGLAEFTGGTTLGGPISFGGPACLDTTAPGCNKALYSYGGTPAKGSDWSFNLREDFAESFAAEVYPAEAKSFVETHFANPAFEYANYLTTPRGMYMGALIFLFTH